MAKQVKITLDYDAFLALLNSGDATKVAAWGKNDGNPGKAILQGVVTINGKDLDSGFLKRGDSGRSVWEKNSDATARGLLREGQIDQYSLTSVGFAALVTIYRIGAEAMPREFAYAETVLSGVAAYNGHKSIDAMIVEPTAKARKSGGITSDQVDAIFS